MAWVEGLGEAGRGEEKKKRRGEQRWGGVLGQRPRRELAAPMFHQWTEGWKTCHQFGEWGIEIPWNQGGKGKGEQAKVPIREENRTTRVKGGVVQKG